MRSIRKWYTDEQETLPGWDFIIDPLSWGIEISVTLRDNNITIWFLCFLFRYWFLRETHEKP